MKECRISFIKYDQSPHYNFTVREISRTDTERWVYSTAGTDLYKGDKHVGQFPNAALQRIALTQPFQETWIFRADPDGRRFLDELYINLILPIDEHTDCLVDMDLDVVVSPAGEAAIVDVDEFRENAGKMRYPQEIMRLIEEGAQNLVQRFSARPDPLSLIPDDIRAIWEKIPLPATP